MEKNENEGNKLGDETTKDSAQINEESMVSNSDIDQEEELKESTDENVDDIEENISLAGSSDPKANDSEDLTDTEDSKKEIASDIQALKEDEQKSIEVTSEEEPSSVQNSENTIANINKGKETIDGDDAPAEQSESKDILGKEDTLIENPKNKELEEENEVATDDVKDLAKGNDDSEGDDKEEEQHFDYTNYTKKQMVQVLESLLKEDNYSQVGKILKEIKKPYDKIANSERKEAYKNFIEDGGEKDGFEYRPEELDQRFLSAYNKLKERKSQYFNSLEKQKEQNLNLKLEILEKLRALVDSEETGASIKELKDLQTQWKEVGVIPVSQAKSLWANFSALLDRFYDQRSIYFELKELDRKKNCELKIELCEKAEALSDEENIREAIKQLNELHEEFKHIGPVPKEDQETIWDRFKTASDKIYTRRKEYYEKLKEELKLNEVAKDALVEKVMPFTEFQSDKISEWNSKTKELIAIQKEWDAIGSLPKEKAKSINKKFWSSFKLFFNNKGHFFKEIEGKRQENLVLKQELVRKAELLKDSEDFRKTSEELKQLQKEWKDIGPVPEKQRNEVYINFKKACDHFFNRRRANSGKVEKDYEENLKKKQSLCEELEKMIESKKTDATRIKTIEEEWGDIGFVPKSNIRTIQKRYSEAISKLVDNLDVSDSEKHKIRFSAQFGGLNYGPGTERLIQKKEGALRRQISTLESDINLWKNNIDFFAASKNADKLKSDFQVKIDKASEQLNSLKEQLKAISNL